jgi:predicted transcriptional regulator
MLRAASVPILRPPYPFATQITSQEPTMADTATPDLLTFTAQIVAAHVAGNKLHADEVPALINDVYRALASTSTPRAQVAQFQEPAVPVKRSIQHDHLVCLEDGAKLKVLTRYLARFGLTRDTYRAKWGLPKDYPMVAPAYAARRSVLAAPKAPHVTGKVEEPTVPVAEPQHTAASVFANFPGDKVPDEGATAPGGAEKPGRKRFAQQSMRVGRKKSATLPM